MILFGPTIRTVIPCGYHQLGATWPDITHDTGSIMIGDILFERIEGAHFILGAVYGSSTFKTVSVFSIFGFVWQTKAVTSSSSVAVMTACYEPWVANQKKTKGVSVNSHKESGQHTEFKRITSADHAELQLAIISTVIKKFTERIYKLFNKCYLQALSRYILPF